MSLFSSMRPIRLLRSSIRPISSIASLPRGYAASMSTCAFSSIPAQSNFSKVLVRKFATTAAVQDVVVPSMGESISEGSVQGWLKNPGDSVKQDEVIAQIETAKIVVEVRSPVAGVLREQLAKVGDTVNPAQVLARIEPGAVGAEPSKPKEDAKPAASKQAPVQAPAPKAAPAPVAAAPAAATGPMIAAEQLETRVRMTRMRQKIAERLKDAQNTYALLTTFNEIDMTALMQMRKDYGDAFEKKHGVKLGFMSPFVKAAANALKAQPVVNAVIDGTDIVYRNYVDISVAVAVPTGLVVPVLRNCQDMNFADVEKELARLSEKARSGQLSIEDMQGGTFTVSNGGIFGSLFGTPIVNPPQSAILGMHATKQRPVAVDGKVEVRSMMYVALTYDHRLIDGREAVTFLKSIKEQIEDPRRIVLDL